MKTVTGFLATIVVGLGIVVGTGALMTACDSPGDGMVVAPILDLPWGCEDCEFTLGGDDVRYFVRDGMARTDVENIQPGDQVVLKDSLQPMALNGASPTARYCVVTYVSWECCMNEFLFCECIRVTCAPSTVQGAN